VNKKFVTLLALIIATVILLSIFFLLPQPTSDELQPVEDTEKSLSLPPPLERTVRDRGEYYDGKGSRHYERSISLSYSDNRLIEIVNTKLISDGLEIVMELQEDKLKVYKNSLNRICIITANRQYKKGEISPSITIASYKDSSCDVYFRE
jgi:hypothetical protein